jgi:hypothetical protein
MISSSRPWPVVHSEETLAVLHPFKIGHRDTPALARYVGITKTLLDVKISSATAVVGPLAPSQRILARTLAAFSER